MRKLVFLAALLFAISVNTYGKSDSLTVSFDNFISLVKRNHPISRQADITMESGKQTLKSARGNFDPLIKSQLDNKEYSGKEYFMLNTNELKIPTIVGLELQAGYETNRGAYLNPENIVPDNGLAYAGFTIPLGNGLFFDERRQALRQAQVYEKSTVLERTLMLNQLIYDATSAYWEWYVSWNVNEIFAESVTLAEIRLSGIRSSFLLGDIPAIDTLEAHILLQTRLLNLNESLIELQNASLKLSNYLWSDEQEPLVLDSMAIPENHISVNSVSVPEAALQSIMSALDSIHPELQLYQNKLQSLDFERRMKSEKIKPKLNVSYNLLNEPVGGNPAENFTVNDYKWGFEFGMPLLLRKERGELQLTKLKINETNLAIDQKRLEIQNKIHAYSMEMKVLIDQIKLYESTVTNYAMLLNGERRKFEEGESSLFLVNSRENSFITAETKLVELYGKYQKAQASLLLAIGGNETLL
jgi:outer membrane protein TolC